MEKGKCRRGVPAHDRSVHDLRRVDNKEVDAVVTISKRAGM